MKNVVSIGTTKSIEKMLGVIKDDGSGGTSDANNREYGGNRNNENVTSVTPGAVADPTKGKNASIVGDVNFHSHPSGQKKLGANTYGWAQPPSKTDINTATGTSFVFGMRSGVIYVFDKKGVKATIPMSIFKNP